MEYNYIIVILILFALFVLFVYYSIKHNKANKIKNQPNKYSKTFVEKTEKEKEYYRIQQDKNKLIAKLKKAIKANENFKNLKIDNIKLIKDFIDSSNIKLEDDKILVFLKIDDFIKKICKETSLEINNIISDLELRRDLDIINTHFYHHNKTSSFIIDSVDVSSLNAGFILPNLIKKIDFYNNNGNKLFFALEEKVLTIKYYNSLSFVMLTYLIKEDKLNFFVYYNLFEKLGVFDSTWQNKILNKLSNIDNNLHKINESLKILNDNLTDVVVELDHLKQELSSSISSLKSSTDINNMISGIQLYQLYQINKKTRKPK